MARGAPHLSGFVFVGAPADSVLRGGGAEGAPTRLRELGVAGVLDDDLGDLPIRVRGGGRDPETGIIGSEQVLSNTRALSAAVEDLVARGGRPFVAGGCCAILPGALAGARDALGSVGLVYVDGHQDLWDGTTSTTGEAADMPLGVAIGVGPARWVEAAGGPGAAPGSVSLVGSRDHVEVAEAGLPDPASYGLTFLPLERVREIGAAEAAERAGEVAGSGSGRHWLHLDVDVIDSELFPATDYPQEDGLSWAELEALVTPLVDERTAGVSIGCFNPDKDVDGSAGDRLADLLVRLLGRRAGYPSVFRA